ncbi:YCF48-related protein [Aeoliella sp. SH292]|uniref:YCF48-related protein n=1 Tax=Aeoliella sp. SH292 TaxID=3454464 RepID=UPI003F9C673B
MNRSTLYAFALATLVLPSFLHAAPPATLSEVLATDATLRDVVFVDAQHGWAVGDRGVVLVTDDGGAHWYPQRSGVDCPLLSVSFVDDKRGWIVGGRATPLTHRSEGVVLRTIDGGTTWQQVVEPTLPRLTYVEFFDAANGVAAGYGSSFYPSGLFTTTDGGKSWQPIGSAQVSTWLAADFVSSGSGLLAGPRGARSVVLEREMRTAGTTTDARQPRAMVIDGASKGWMVGDNGMVLTTSDSGATWQPPATEPLAIDPITRRQWSWNSVAVQGNHVWLAGAPGSVIAHSADNGATWSTTTTGLRAPVTQMHFVDDRRGWTVGELGTILATTDGGRSWRRQRGGGHAAMLVVVATPEDVPLEVVSRYAAGEGFRTVVVPLFAAKTSSVTELDTHRVTEALTAAGAIVAPPLWAGEMLPVGYHASPETLMEEMNRRTDGLARDELLATAVLAIRTWQPDLLVVPHERNPNRDAGSTIAEQLAIEASRHAADSTQGLELATIDLPAWQVKRTVGLAPPGERGSIRVATDEFVPALGGSPASWSSLPRSLLFTKHTIPSPLDELELLSQLDGMATNTRDPFAGLQLPPACDARRTVVASNPNDLERLRKLTQKRGQLVRLLDYSEGNPIWSAQVVNLTGGLDPQTGGELVYQLAEGYRETGRHAMAADTMYLLARRYPDHPLTEQALVWLVRYYASGEVSHVTARQQAMQARTKPLANVDYKKSAGAPRNESIELPTNDDGGTATLTSDERLERASLLGGYLEKARPALYSEPALRFPLAVTSRKLGYNNTTERYFMVLGRSGSDRGWSSAARVENWLAKPDELPPSKPLVTCKATLSPPRLDGVFDEAMWKSAEMLRVATSAGRNDDTAATMQLARDTDYLYVAITCPLLRDEKYEATSASRTRDADLSAYDRVRLSIDIDRDYVSAYEMTVDCRGWTHDTCWGDKNWNPRWFVASKMNETNWTAELAIPWSEVVKPEPAVLDTWCLRVTRQNARGHSASWTGVSGDTPDSFGLLLFR